VIRPHYDKIIVSFYSA